MFASHLASACSVPQPCCCSAAIVDAATPARRHRARRADRATPPVSDPATDPSPRATCRSAPGLPRPPRARWRRAACRPRRPGRRPATPARRRRRATAPPATRRRGADGCRRSRPAGRRRRNRAPQGRGRGPAPAFRRRTRSRSARCRGAFRASPDGRPCSRHCGAAAEAACRPRIMPPPAAGRCRDRR